MFAPHVGKIVVYRVDRPEIMRRSRRRVRGEFFGEAGIPDRIQDSASTFHQDQKMGLAKWSAFPKNILRPQFDMDEPTEQIDPTTRIAYASSDVHVRVLDRSGAAIDQIHRQSVPGAFERSRPVPV